MTRLPERAASQRDLDECLRALRNAWHHSGQGTSGRILAGQLNWRLTRTEAVLAELKASGNAGQHPQTGAWYPVVGL